ncbi:7-deoxyloganetin glucosyltransferase [Quercus suber]|uniref:7-deoxyloganetin glucosyltransferase n=1 Tax=Quercus suber TaxID=58331 RepID=A0AAW0K7Y2_QUESU
MGSMGSEETPKPHAVFLPYPSQGHVTPMMRLAKLLHSRGFHITFVNTKFNHRRLIKSKGLDYVKGLPDFRFETIPDGLPPFDRDAKQDIPALSFPPSSFLNVTPLRAAAIIMPESQKCWALVNYTTTDQGDAC